MFDGVNAAVPSTPFTCLCGRAVIEIATRFFYFFFNKNILYITFGVM